MDWGGVTSVRTGEVLTHGAGEEGLYGAGGGGWNRVYHKIDVRLSIIFFFIYSFPNSGTESVSCIDVCLCVVLYAPIRACENTRAL